MAIDIDPPVGVRERLVVRRALDLAAVAGTREPPSAGSEWRRSAAREAVETDPVDSGYARSPRRTRGATRA